MPTLAFIGLGIMGNPMSVHLQHAGFEVRGYDLVPDRTSELVAAGGVAASSIAAAVDGADFIVTMVPDSPQVRTVLTGEDGVFTHASAGALIIDFSTIRPDVTVELARAAESHGMRLLDAPVSGGEPGAIAGTLSIMVGGDPDDFAAAASVFEAVGSTVVHVGSHGAGQTVKAANQLVVAANIEAVAEAIAFLQAHQVDLPAAIEVLAGGLAGSAVLNQKATKMLQREFAPGFRMELHHKDMGIVTAAAREAGITIPLGALVAQLVGSAVACGDAHLDHSGLFRGVERLSGL